ncbi:hypothetical protein PG990_000572 [Apiospora arundinis]
MNNDRGHHQRRVDLQHQVKRGQQKQQDHREQQHKQAATVNQRADTKHFNPRHHLDGMTEDRAEDVHEQEALGQHGADFVEWRLRVGFWVDPTTLDYIAVDVADIDRKRERESLPFLAYNIAAVDISPALGVGGAGCVEVAGQPLEQSSHVMAPGSHVHAEIGGEPGVVGSLTGQSHGGQVALVEVAGDLPQELPGEPVQQARVNFWCLRW